LIFSDKIKGFAAGGAMPYYVTLGKNESPLVYANNASAIDIDKIYDFV